MDARATEVISAIMPRRRAKREQDVVPPEAEAEPPTGAVAHTAGEPQTARRSPAAPADATPETATPETAAPETSAPETAAASSAEEPPESGSAPSAEPGIDEPPPRRGTTAVRIAAAVLAALVLVSTAAGFANRNTVDGGIVDVDALDPGSDAISQRAVQAGDENVLVLGLAADRLREPEGARTDTAVLVHMPAGGGPAVTLSMPATLEVARPPCRRWDPANASYGGSVPAESRTTLSAVYDVGGPACAVGAVQQLTGLLLTRFVALDLSGADALVSAVRGVQVCTERPVIDRALGPVVIRAGSTTLTGSDAVRFAGAAAVVDDTSPANRIQRQQRVLADAMGQALSTSTLLTPGAPTRISQALSRSLITDDADAAEVLTLARSLSRAGTAGDGSTPAFLPVPVNEQPNTRGHMELRRGDAEDLFSAMRKHEPLPEEITAPAQRAAASALPQGVSIDVLNAAGRAGLAGQVADSLRAQGFRVGDVSDAPESPQTMVRFSPDRADVAGRLTASLPAAVPAPDPASSSTVQLVLGSGFTGPVTVPALQPSDEAVDCG
ncbi:LytR family transcriptional attenuator [Pseudonocardia sediminis]|uniref:LytR family transcriptional attenuator n=1 Tax=Pseudonocardia sediminis TaxID=1397368 RepID=A0A4Q7UUF1_PSEST|nr:LCP family protein [Pseudonocardia sediminis]RZT83653.1 LytR family transcriptional attenuator [Pseudonocardia sediminis]